MGNQENCLKLATRRTWFASDGRGRIAFSLGRPPPGLAAWDAGLANQDARIWLRAPSIMESTKDRSSSCDRGGTPYPAVHSSFFSQGRPAGRGPKSGTSSTNRTTLFWGDWTSLVLVSTAACLDKATKSDHRDAASGNGHGLIGAPRQRRLDAGPGPSFAAPGEAKEQMAGLLKRLFRRRVKV